MSKLMIEVEKPKTLLMEISYIHGVLNGREIPEMTELTKIIAQINGENDET